MTQDENTGEEVPTREGYDRWSALYDDYANPLITLETPEIRRLMGDVEGLAVLDVGCGTGRHSLWLAKGGARVTAVDFSTGMLEQARSKDGADLVRFLAHDLHEALPFEAGTFDRIVHCLALDHLDDPQALLEQFARVLKPGGFAVVSVMHPAMFLKGTQARFVDPQTGELVVIENKQYTVSEYVMATQRAGLEMEFIEEHICHAAIAESTPRAAKYLNWPMLLTFVARAK